MHVFPKQPAHGHRNASPGDTGFSLHATGSKLCSSGFTLIELLVVIVILAMLASLVTPSIANALESAKSVSCRNNLKQWGAATQLYANENEGRLPSSYRTTTSTSPVRSTYSWYKYGEDVLKYGSATRECPSRAPRNLQINSDRTISMLSDLPNGWDPKVATSSGYYRGYTPNAFWFQRDDQWQGAYLGLPIFRITRPAETLMFADGDTELYPGGSPERAYRYRHGRNGRDIHVLMFDGALRAWSVEVANVAGPRFLGGAPPLTPPLWKINQETGW